MSNEAILEELKTQSGEIKDLTSSVNNFAKAIAEKSVHDEYLRKEVEVLKDLISVEAEKREELEDRISDLEIAAAGDAKLAEIKGWFLKAIVTAAAVGCVSGVIWLIVKINGGA